MGNYEIPYECPKCHEEGRVHSDYPFTAPSTIVVKHSCGAEFKFEMSNVPKVWPFSDEEILRIRKLLNAFSWFEESMKNE
jgi:hypothetical protein